MTTKPKTAPKAAATAPKAAAKAAVPTTKVTSVPTTFTFAGQKYGPFRASADKGFTEVPTALAIAAHLPTFNDEQADVTAAVTGTNAAASPAAPDDAGADQATDPSQSN